MRTYINERGEEEEMVEIPFVAVVDRTERQMCIDTGKKQVWLPNEDVGEIDELRGVVYVTAASAEEAESA